MYTTIMTKELTQKIIEESGEISPKDLRDPLASQYLNGKLSLEDYQKKLKSLPGNINLQLDQPQ